MTTAGFRTSRQRTAAELSTEDAKLNAALGLGEAGELQNIIKKELYHGHEPDRFKVLDEAGDQLYYLDWILELYGWTLDDAFAHNHRKLLARYPNGFSSADSINRSDGG